MMRDVVNTEPGNADVADDAQGLFRKQWEVYRKVIDHNYPFSLEERDFADALRERSETALVAWLGQSLHHLSTGGKLAVMRDIRRLLDGGGLVLPWEPTRFDGEGRDTWFHRMETRCRPWSTALNPPNGMPWRPMHASPIFRRRPRAGWSWATTRDRVLSHHCEGLTDSV